MYNGSSVLSCTFSAPSFKSWTLVLWKLAFHWIVCNSSSTAVHIASLSYQIFVVLKFKCINMNIDTTVYKSQDQGLSQVCVRGRCAAFRFWVDLWSRLAKKMCCIKILEYHPKQQFGITVTAGQQNCRSVDEYKKTILVDESNKPRGTIEAAVDDTM